MAPPACPLWLKLGAIPSAFALWFGTPIRWYRAPRGSQSAEYVCLGDEVGRRHHVRPPPGIGDTFEKLLASAP